MVSDGSFLGKSKSVVDLLVCCVHRDGTADDDPLHRRSPHRTSKRGSVERKALVAQHLSEVSSFNARYDSNPQDVLGTGSYGVVRKASLRRCPSIVRAVKEVRKGDPSRAHLIQ